VIPLTTPTSGPTWSPARVAVLVGIGLLTLVVLTFAALHIATRPYGAGSAAALPQAGDCVTSSGSGGGAVRIVDCDDSNARYEIIGTFTGVQQQDRCADVPGSEFALTRSEPGGRTSLLCVSLLDVQGRGQNE
jgi:hypothetical protein